MPEEPKRPALTPEERYYLASQWQLMWVKFRRHKLALVGGSVLAALYLAAIFADFWAPYTVERRFAASDYHPPTAIHIFDTEGRLQWPFVYDTTSTRDPNTLARIHTEDTGVRFPIQLFFQGEIQHGVQGIRRAPKAGHFFHCFAAQRFILGQPGLEHFEAPDPSSEPIIHLGAQQAADLGVRQRSVPLAEGPRHPDKTEL